MKVIVDEQKLVFVGKGKEIVQLLSYYAKRYDTVQNCLNGRSVIRKSPRN